MLKAKDLTLKANPQGQGLKICPRGHPKDQGQQHWCGIVSPALSSCTCTATAPTYATIATTTSTALVLLLLVFV